MGKAHLDTGPVALQVWRETVQEQGIAWVPHLVGTDLAWKETVLELQGWKETVQVPQGLRGTVQVHPDLEGIQLGQLGLQGTGAGPQGTEPGLQGTGEGIQGTGAGLQGIGLGLQGTGPGLQGTGLGLLGQEQMAQSGESQKGQMGGQCLLRMGTEGHQGLHQASRDC